MVLYFFVIRLYGSRKPVKQANSKDILIQGAKKEMNENLKEWTGTGVDCVVFVLKLNDAREMQRAEIYNKKTGKAFGNVSIKKNEARVSVVLPDLTARHNAKPWGAKEKGEWRKAIYIISRSLEDHGINTKESDLISVTAEINSTQKINASISSVIKLLHLSFLDDKEQSALYSQKSQDRSPRHTGSTAIYKKNRNDFVIKVYDKGDKLKKDGNKNVPDVALLRIEFIIKRRKLESLYQKQNNLENILKNPEILIREYKVIFKNVLWDKQVLKYLLDVNAMMVKYLDKHEKDNDKYITMIAIFKNRIVDERQVRKAVMEHCDHCCKINMSKRVITMLGKKGIVFEKNVINCLKYFYKNI